MDIDKSKFLVLDKEKRKTAKIFSGGFDSRWESDGWVEAKKCCYNALGSKLANGTEAVRGNKIKPTVQDWVGYLLQYPRLKVKHVLVTMVNGRMASGHQDIRAYATC